MAKVNMPESNNQAKPEPLDAVVVSDTTRNKKTGLAKWKDVFLAVNKDEFIQTFTDNLLYPGLKDLAVRFAHGAIDILANGSSTSANPWSSPYYRGSEGTPYYRVAKETLVKPMGKTAAGYCLDEIGYDTWDEAMDVLNKLNESIRDFSVVDVYAFYEWSRQNGDFVDKGWGWETPITCKPVMRRDGKYFLPLPKPKKLNQK